MIFLPMAMLAVFWIILLLPVLFFFGYLNVLTAGFAQLGISPGMTLFILFCTLIGSSINIPLTKKKTILSKKSYFFGMFSRPVREVHCVAVNVGGAIIPILLSFYFLWQVYNSPFSVLKVLAGIALMTIVAKFYSKVVPSRGIVLPLFIPPLFSTLFSFLLMPNFAAPFAFVSGILGTLIGADLLNLKEMRKSGGFLSIGGAGVFDGIFLTGIVAALLAG